MSFIPLKDLLLLIEQLKILHSQKCAWINFYEWDIYVFSGALLCWKNVDVSLIKVNSCTFLSETSTFFQVPCYAVGLKSRAVCVVDQRTDSCNLTCPNASDYCIDCLKIHQDENYITSSNWNGKVFFWFSFYSLIKIYVVLTESLPF